MIMKHLNHYLLLLINAGTLYISIDIIESHQRGTPMPHLAIAGMTFAVVMLAAQTLVLINQLQESLS
jgi:hypothetical protein